MQSEHKPISCIIQPVHGKGGLYLGDYTSTEVDNLQKYGVKAIVTVLPNADVEHSKTQGYVRDLSFGSSIGSSLPTL